MSKDRILYIGAAAAFTAILLTGDTPQALVKYSQESQQNIQTILTAPPVAPEGWLPTEASIIAAVRATIIPEKTSSVLMAEKTQQTPAKQILYTRDVDPSSERFSPRLFISEPNGSNEKRLNDENFEEYNARISPDGNQIVYVSNAGEYGGNYVIVSLNMAKVLPEKTILTKGDHSHWDPSFSPDGEWIYLKINIDDEGDIFRMKKDGSGSENLTQGLPGEQWKPEASPDGKYIYFTSGVDKEAKLIRQNLETQERDVLTDGRYHSVNREDGRIVLSRIDENGRDRLYILDPSTFNTSDPSSTLLTLVPNQPEGEYDNSDPNWIYTEEGWKIIFVNSKRGDYNLMIINTDGTNAKELTNKVLRHLSPEPIYIISKQ